MAEKSPWSTINALLNENRCWLCGETFPRRQQKKVFQVFHLLQFFESISKLESESNDSSTPKISTDFHSENLKACYAKFVVDGGIEKMNDIVNIMRVECDMEPWMSGLTCSGNEMCLKEYSMIVPDKPVSDSSSFGMGVKRFQSEDNKDCPPGCDCDNPWAFIK